VIDLGTVIAEGTSDELKDTIGGEVLEMQVADHATVTRAAEALSGIGTAPAQVDQRGGRVKIPVGIEGASLLVDVVRRLDDAQVKIVDLALHRPTLDDVFLKLTGHAAEEASQEGEASGRRRGRRKRGDAA
jgi:ABC-2 type transport system ATP-binding protein